MSQQTQVADTAKNAPPALTVRRRRLGRLGRGILLRFFLFALLSLLVMLVVIGYALLRQYEDVRAQQQIMARWTANSLSGWLTNLTSQATSAAQSTAMLDESTEQIRAYLNSVLLRSPAFSSATLVDMRQGRPQELGTASHESTSAMPYLSEWLTPTLEQGYYIAPMHFVKGMPMVVVAAAMRKGGQTVGIVAMQADLSQTYHVLNLAKTERGGYAYAVDGEGHAVLHLNSPFMYSRQVFTDVAGVKTVLAGQLNLPPLYQGLNSQREWVIGGAATLRPTVPWTVIAEQPVAPLVEQIWPIAAGALGILLLSAVAALAVGLYISRRVATPIAALQESARRMGTGDLEHRISLPGSFELSDLAEELNRMAAGLRESQARQEAWGHELEQKVAERTAELSRALEQLREESQAKENLLVLVKEMSSPVIPVMEGIIVIPIVGALDSERAQRVMDDLLAGIEREQAHVAILDITGLAVVDTAVANALLQASRAAQLLGAQPILVGISPEVAETLVQLGVELRHLRTAATLQEGLQMALGMLKRRLVAIGS